jgi:DNA-binding GntR family transcriptional regulator
MSTIEVLDAGDPAQPTARTLRVRSVVGLAYDEIRSLIVSGALGSGARLGQAELAEQLGISRTSVREALRRLAGDGLVEFEVNRGFFVVDIGLDSVLQRLEARLVLEPSIARLAAERRSEADLDAMRAAIAAERAATTSDDGHDASRAFHMALAAATGNEALVRLLDTLWIADVGRRLLAQRRVAPTWQDADVTEHREIADAVEAGDAARAERLMRSHVESAFVHWSGRHAHQVADERG